MEYEWRINMDDKRPKCPKCENPLVLYVKTNAHWSKKIKKDGSLYKTTNYSIGFPTDILFLACDKYGCGFSYDITYPGNNKKEYSTTSKEGFL